jgi:hypothetical protein
MMFNATFNNILVIVIRIRISKKNKQHNGKNKTYKRTNNDLQIIKHKTKDRVTRTHYKRG